MFISDLNHLETVEANHVIGGRSGGSRNRRIDFDKDINIDIDVDSRVNSRANVIGNVAQGYADAFASGRNTFTDAETITSAVENRSSSSVSNSTSAVR